MPTSAVTIRDGCQIAGERPLNQPDLTFQGVDGAQASDFGDFLGQRPRKTVRSRPDFFVGSGLRQLEPLPHHDPKSRVAKVGRQSRNTAVSDRVRNQNASLGPVLARHRFCESLGQCWDAAEPIRGIASMPQTDANGKPTVIPIPPIGFRAGII